MLGPYSLNSAVISAYGKHCHAVTAVMHSTPTDIAHIDLCVSLCEYVHREAC